MQCWVFNHFTLFMLSFKQFRPFIVYSKLRLTFQVYFALSFHITPHVHHIHLIFLYLCVASLMCLRFSPCDLEDIVNPLDPPFLQIDIALGIQSRVGTITKSKLLVVFFLSQSKIFVSMISSLIVFPTFLHLDNGFPFALFFRSHQPISFLNSTPTSLTVVLKAVHFGSIIGVTAIK